MRNKKLSCSRWLQERTPLEKTLISFSFLLLLTVILLIVLGISFGGTEDEGPTLCLSKECIQTASQILSKMEDSWNPCSNFYEYSCGEMNKSLGTTIPRGTLSFLKNLLETSTDKRIASAKSIYERCVEFSGLQDGGKKPDEILRDLFKRFGIGTWPVVDTFYDDSLLTQNERLAALALLGIPVAYTIEVSASNRSLKLSPGGPQMSGKMAEEIRDDMKLKTHLLSSFHLLGAPYDRSISDADDIFSVEMWYAKIKQSAESPCNTVSYISPQESIDELNRLIPEYQWDVLINAVQKTANLNTPFAVELHCKEEIRDYIVYLKDISFRSAYNYIGWRFYSAFEKHIVPEFSHHLQNSNSLRWMDCIALIEQYASQPLTEALTRHFIPHSTLQEVEQMAEDVDKTIQRHFPTKKPSKQLPELKKSLDRVKEPFDSRAIKRTLPQVHLNNYTSVIIELRRQSIVKELQKLRNPFSEEDEDTVSRNLLLTLLTTEGIHFTEVSKWFSYGSLGTILSRELYKELFVERCLEKKTDICSSTIPYIQNLDTNFGSVQIKEENLMKEVLFDVCAVEMAYESFKHSRSSFPEVILPGITKNQMFFIIYAQTFCEADVKESRNIINKRRLNDFASKSSAFHETFHCESSTPFDCSTFVP